MTREEALEYIKSVREFYATMEKFAQTKDEAKFGEALDMAIEALKTEPTDADMISQADAIGSVIEVSTYLDLPKAYCERLINGIKALPSADAVQGWIPCNERLPEDGTTVITFDSMGDIEFGSYENGKWYWLAEACADYWTRNSGVLAWMPLSKPYRGEQIDSNT